MTDNTQSIVITINTTNDAFLFPSPDLEVVRILRDLADRIERRRTPSFLYDANGNVVGNVALFNQPSNI